MTEKAAIDLFAVQAETPLAIVNRVLMSGNFAPAPEEPIGDNETVISECTPFERAVFTARAETSRKNNDLAKEAWGLQEESPDKLEHVLAQMAQLKKEHELFNSLLWVSIENRLGASANGGGGVGIRQDYQIVQLGNGHGFPGGLMGMMLAGMGAGEMPDHDCDNCSNYDECDLPNKKPRA